MCFKITLSANIAALSSLHALKDLDRGSSDSSCESYCKQVANKAAVTDLHILQDLEDTLKQQL